MDSTGSSDVSMTSMRQVALKSSSSALVAVIYPSPLASLVRMTVLSAASVMPTTFSRPSEYVHTTSLDASASPFAYTVAEMDVRAFSAMSRTMLLLSNTIPVIVSSPSPPWASTMTVASAEIEGSDEEYAVTVNCPGFFVLNVAVLSFPVSSTAPSDTDQRIAVSSVAGTGEALRTTSFPASVTTRLGHTVMALSGSSRVLGLPTMIFAVALMVPVEAVTVTTPAERGENMKSRPSETYSMAPSGSSTVQSTDLPEMYSPFSSYTPA